jgi:pyruvate,water dikinase
MRSAGLAVPPGFVVTAAAFEDSLADRGVLEELRALARSVATADEKAPIIDEIRQIITGEPLSQRLVDEISIAYAGLGPGVFVAVRSSARAEDGEAASFAGQQETFLNVRGIDQVLERIVECWASFFSERAFFYRQRKGSLADLGMAVVVQQQIDSDKSGVMFTTDPIRGRSDQMVIEAALGLGESLVSGLITPDHYVARRDGRLKKAHVGEQGHLIVRHPDGGTQTLDLDPERANLQVLDEDEIARLVEIGLALEAEFGSPQDVEWAFAGDELYVLQSRPITT